MALYSGYVTLGSHMVGAWFLYAKVSLRQQFLHELLTDGSQISLY